MLELALAYATPCGKMFVGKAEDALRSGVMDPYRGQVQLIFTSPPFPLNRKKAYGNLVGQEYIDWLAGFAEVLQDFLAPDGSIALELGNSWEPGEPVMSTLAIEALLEFRKRGELKLCQQFVCPNPARLPSPAQWVNVERTRVKDAFTHVWWMAKTAHPKADNRRVLVPYSAAMRKLIDSKRYNAGPRPSGHVVGAKSFLKDNGGAIPANVVTATNTRATDAYLAYCRENDVQPHPARMAPSIAEFFIKFLTEPGDLVLDPFAGSNVTGAVAESEGRRWLAVEANKEYAEASKSRFTAL